ncbi:restriction endonuclease subunit S [Desulfobacter sp.]|uniref:restriction endonuclease subunit S n=1 Tax=Desulfobacter sp. TaxID=2294 RepID=UPI003D14DF9C
MDWTETHFGQLVKGVRGVSFDPTDLLEHSGDNSVTLLRANNIVGNQLKFENTLSIPLKKVKKDQLMQTGDIAVCMSNGSKALVGKSAQYNDEYKTALSVGAFCSIFKPQANAVADFIPFLFQSHTYQKQIDISLSGSAINNLKNSDIETITFRIPSPKYQNKIASILKTIDTAIHKTEVLIQKYQQIKQGLMHDLFTRGVTPNGKLRPTREQIPELYKETSIGWIPREWKVNRIRSLCHPVTKGATPSKFVDHYDSENSVPFVRVENLTFDGSFKTEKSLLFVDKKVHDRELMRSKIFPGDILMNIVGPPLGKVSFVPEDFKEFNTNQAVAIFRTFSKKHRNFLLYYLLSDFSQRWFYVRSKQTSGQVNLTLEMCSDLEIPFPQNDREVERISTAIYIVYQKLESEVSIYKKLQNQKSGLIHDLMTGKVRVTVDE